MASEYLVVIKLRFIALPSALARVMFATADFLDTCKRVVCVFVTTASAVPKFTDGIAYLCWVFGLRVFARFVVIGMTACAVRLVRAEFPADRLTVGRMALYTPYGSAVPRREKR